jgi:hypothetical protein
MGVINRGHEWNTLDNITTSEFEDDKTLKAIMFLMIKELAIKCPNNQELGAEVRQLIKDYKLNTNTNG